MRPLLSWVLAGVCALYVAGLGNRGLRLSDEPRDAGISAWMASSGDFVVPRLNGRPFLEKPPLSYAAAAASLRCWPGGRLTAVRLPSALFAVGALLATAWLGTRLAGAPAGLLAACILGTSLAFFDKGHECCLDAGLFLWGVLAYAAAHLALESGRAWHWMLCGAALGAGFLTKGPIGVLVPGVGLAGFLAWGRRWSLKPLWALLPLSLLALAWVVPLDRAGFLEPYLAEQARRTGSRVEHAGPAYAYLLWIFEDFAPWSALIPFLGVWLWRRRPEGLGLAVAWLLGALVLLSIPASKRGIYLVPAFPALAILLAAMITDPRRGPRALKAATFAASLLVLAGALWVTLGEPRLRAKDDPFTGILAKARGAEIAGRGLSEPMLGGLVFHLGKVKELEDGAELSSWLAAGRRLALVQEMDSAWDVPFLPILKVDVRHEHLVGFASPELALETASR